ncbi:MAG: Gfo/Idh/MocA family oxidoreductase [Erysipelotrichaceae bacterium]|nr:Gfo/Idh/MocA family oxidoreductase [Erysipelotrichaceae bacterium]
MKLGIIGTGMIVNNFLPFLVKMEGLSVNAILSTPRSVDKAKELAGQYGIANVTSDFDEFCGFDIDTVYVAVPNYMHFDYCKKAMERKLNVIVEKPMVSNDTEAKALRDIAVNNHCFLFEAITTLYLGNYKKVKEWLPRIGTVKIAQSQYSQYSSRYNAFRAGEVLPAFDPAKAGGALMDLNLYNMHYIMGLFGMPKSYKYYANVERGIDTSGTLIMEYDGFQAICLAAKDSKGLRGGIIQGTDGVIKTDVSPNLVGKAVLELNDGTVEEYDDGFTNKRMIPEFEAFIKAINAEDYDFCYEMLDKSVAVAEVQTKARLAAGIVFDADK